MGRLDPRLRLAACSGKLEAFMPPGARVLGNTTVGVRCAAAGGWTVYVSARVALYGEVLVTTQPLARGETISADRVRLVERDLATLSRGYFDAPEPVIGQLATRSLNADTVLNPQLVEAPLLVKRGEQVTLITGRPGFMIRSSGQALADGGSGDLIRIRSKGSKRIVEGRVVSQGVVKVTL
jgi:flagella basal body P-ring formation protein FlgA